MIVIICVIENIHLFIDVDQIDCMYWVNISSIKKVQDNNSNFV
jgi:hypothetical protein